MKKRNYKKIAKSVIDLEIKALKKLKNSINNSLASLGVIPFLTGVPVP